MELDIVFFSSNEPGPAPYTGALGEVWAGMQLAYPAFPDGMETHLIWQEWLANDSIVMATGVKNGGVVIFDTQRSVALVKIEPGAVTRSNVAAKIKMLIGVEYDGDSGYVNADGSAWGFGSGQGNECIFAQLPILGDSLSILCDLEKYIMLGLSAFLTFRAIDSNNDNGKAAWGTAAAFTGYKAAQGFKLLQ